MRKGFHRRKGMSVKHSVAVLLLVLVAAGVTAAEESKAELAFTSKPVIVAFAGEAYEYAPQVAGAEGPTFRLKTAPAGMSIDPATGKVTWLPAHNQAPYQQAAIEVSSGGRTAVQEFEVHVIGLNDAQVAAMRKVNEGFTGVDHSFIGIGDSITSSFAWVLDMTWRGQDHSPSWNRAAGYVFIERGPEHGSKGGWRTTNITGDSDGKYPPTVIEYALTHDRPEVATVMFGTNDIVNVPVELYARNLAFVVDKSLQHHTIPILCVPTRYTWKKRSGEMFDVTRYFPEIRRIARERNLPLVDLDKLFENEPDPLSLFSDGVHPNNSKDPGPYQLDDRRFGYNVINHALYHMYRALIDRGVIDDVPR